jgi:thiol-disulfide isomerase/thioredoxin
VSTDQPGTQSTAPEQVEQPRQPRKIFLVVGLVVAAALGVGLFTSVGANPATSGAPHEGGPVPSFSSTRLNGSGSLSVPADGGGHGVPAVLLFFGNWCASCHQELPPLAAAVRQQNAAGGALSHIHVIGVDSEDNVADGRAFIKSSGVTFPVAYDPTVQITSGAFYFDGDPYAVFVRADGTIDRIVRGATLTPAGLLADERRLIPSGS